MPDVIKRLRQRLSRHPRGWGRGSAKMVRDREKLGGRLAGAIETFVEKGVPRLAERQAPYLLAGETPPDYKLPLELARRELEDRLQLLIQAAEDLHNAAWHLHVAQKERRKCSRENAYPTVRDTRRRIELVLGREAGRKVHGLEGRTRRKIEPLKVQVRILLRHLEAYSGKALERVDGGTVDPAVWLGDVAAVYGRLEELEAELILREEEEAGCRILKEQAMEAYDAAYSRTLRYVKGVAAMAGYSDRRLRRLRTEVDRRRLKRWAAFRRESRARQKKLAEAARRQARATVTTLSGWLRRG